MSKIAIITDSNSGITQSQAKELGIFVVPMPVIINGETYYEDLTLSKADFYEMLKSDPEVSTSQPNPTDITKLWTDILKEYDGIIHMPMSSGLSGTCSTAYTLSKEARFDGKVLVVDNQRISITLRQSVLDAIKMVELGYGLQEIYDVLMADKFNSSIYIMLDTLYYLKKGGRITPAAAALGTILKLKPVLQIQGEKLDAFSKARTTKAGRETMINAIRKDMENRFGGITDEETVFIDIAHTNNLENALSFKEEIQKAFPQCKNIYIDELSLSVSCHIGPGSLAIAACKKLDIRK